MLAYFKLNSFNIVLGLIAIKYSIQYYFTFPTRKQKILAKEKPYVHSLFIWINALVIFAIFIINYNSVNNQLLGLVTLLIGLVIGSWGIINLNDNYHENLVIYENFTLIKTGIFSVVRHPIRLGICLETLALVIFINSIYVIPLLLLFYYLNYKRTFTEEQFLIKIFKDEAKLYCQKVPQFNIVKGMIIKGLLGCPTNRSAFIWIGKSLLSLVQSIVERLGARTDNNGT
ncbi:MAG: methyltransferase [Candidatus Brocadiales bacterium]|nr:methyltransferase [Candidatus Brocadiales bacterium]